MQTPLRIALVGDYNPEVIAHQAIPRAFALLSEAHPLAIHAEWISTESITGEDTLASYQGVWCVPASPYRSMEGALIAVRYARENRLPFLGTCGGCQHAVIEYARSVLGWNEADHAETSPDSPLPIISPLECAMVEVTDRVSLREGTLIANAYGSLEATEGYRCRYGLNPEFQERLFSSSLRVSAEDAQGNIRAVELEGHPFFVGTLFQLERAALQGRIPPLLTAFVSAIRG